MAELVVSGQFGCLYDGKGGRGILYALMNREEEMSRRISVNCVASWSSLLGMSSAPPCLVIPLTLRSYESKWLWGQQVNTIEQNVLSLSLEFLVNSRPESQNLSLSFPLIVTM